MDPGFGSLFRRVTLFMIIIDMIRIGNRDIGDGWPVFIIAELSANHKGKIIIRRRISFNCEPLQTFCESLLLKNLKL